MRIILLFFLTFFISCQEHQRESNIRAVKKHQLAASENKIQELAKLSFRRSYAGHEHISEKELKVLQNSHPTLETLEDSEITRQLNKLQLLHGDQLITSKFENKKLIKDYLDQKRTIEITCQYDQLNYSEIKFTIKNTSEKVTKILDFKGDHIIGVLVKDIDGDNSKEILILTYYYIMNGDNFDL